MSDFVRALTVTLVLIVASPLLGDEKRQHGILRSPGGMPLATYTDIRITDPEGLVDRGMLLFTDVMGDQLLFELEERYHLSEVTESLTHVESGVSLRLWRKRPFLGTTREEMQNELRGEGGDMNTLMTNVAKMVTDNPDLPIRVSHRDQSWQATMSVLNHPEQEAATRLRRAVTASLDSELFEALQRLRLLSEATVIPIPALIEFALADRHSPAGPDITDEPVHADCDYDAAFGYPCSMEQQREVTRASLDGRKLFSY